MKEKNGEDVTIPGLETSTPKNSKFRKNRKMVSFYDLDIRNGLMRFLHKRVATKKTKLAFNDKFDSL